MKGTQEYDVFICHAGEDHGIVRPLFNMFRIDHDLTVWCDDDEDLMSGVLGKSIDIGLKNSRCGVAIVSPSFISKAAGSLIEKELYALMNKDLDTDEDVFFPVWFDVTKKQVREFSPILEAFYALHLEKKEEIPGIARQLARWITKSRLAEQTGRSGEMQQIEAVNEMGEDGFKVLIHLLDNPDFEIRVAAIRSLGEYRDVQALQPLVRAIRQIRTSNISEIRARRDHTLILFTAMDALTKIGKEAVPELIHHLRDTYWLVRWVALSVLWKLEDPSAISPLITMLQDKHIDVKRDAAYVLGDISDLRAIEPLNIALNDSDQKVRTNAKEALNKIAARSSAPRTQGAQNIVNQQNRRALYSEMISAAEELVIRLHNVDVETGLNKGNESYFRSTRKLAKMENKPIRFDVYESLRESDPVSYHQLSDAREIEKTYTDLKIAIEQLDSFRHTPYSRNKGLQELDKLIEVVMNSIILIDHELNKNAPILQQIDNGKYLERWRKLKSNFETWYKVKNWKNP